MTYGRVTVKIQEPKLNFLTPLVFDLITRKAIALSDIQHDWQVHVQQVLSQLFRGDEWLPVNPLNNVTGEVPGMIQQILNFPINC